MKSSVLKYSLIFLLYCTAISFFLIGVRLIHEEQAAKKQLLQKGIAQNVIRLHVKANSNSTKDQLLKLHVRDAVISDLQNCLKKSTSRKAAEQMLISRLADIRQTAEKQLRKEGSFYTVKIALSDRLFPQKKYGDMTFPAGIYRAICIEIGHAEGHNWWCVLFPSLCFVDETTATVPKESKKKLKKSLTKEEYKLLTRPPEAHSLFLDWFSTKKNS